MPISHLGHAELLVPNVEESTAFFTQIIGLQLTEKHDGQAYLRGWQDWDHSTLILTEAGEPGLGHLAWRVPTKADGDQLRAAVEERGISVSAIDGGSVVGHGDAYRFITPGGIPMELYWEVERFQARGAQVSRLKSHPNRVPLSACAPRRIDHCGILVADVQAEQEFLTDVLGIPHRYYVTGPDGKRWGSWLSATNVSHEISLVPAATGYFHHLAYHIDTPEMVLRAATILIDYGYELEWGPGKHGTSGGTYLYFREPSGNRVELWSDGMMIFAPDWEPLEWTPEIAEVGRSMWGEEYPESFSTGTQLAGSLVASS
jgi:catechol 2,3 dioxygenase